MIAMTIEEEITELTERWYRYVNKDHHKDRDCHFYITKEWSYGDKPYYVATHNGYRAKRWESPRCANAAAAQVCLRDFLKGEIEDVINVLREDIAAYDLNNENWWKSLEEMQSELAALLGEKEEA